MASSPMNEHKPPYAVTRAFINSTYSVEGLPTLITGRVRLLLVLCEWRNTATVVSRTQAHHPHMSAGELRRQTAALCLSTP